MKYKDVVYIEVASPENPSGHQLLVIPMLPKQDKT